MLYIRVSHYLHILYVPEIFGQIKHLMWLFCIQALHILATHLQMCNQWHFIANKPREEKHFFQDVTVWTDQSVLWNPASYWNHTIWSDLLFHNTKYNIHYKRNTRGATQKHFKITFRLVSGEFVTLTGKLLCSNNISLSIRRSGSAVIYRGSPQYTMTVVP